MPIISRLLFEYIPSMGKFCLRYIAYNHRSVGGGPNVGYGPGTTRRRQASLRKTAKRSRFRVMGQIRLSRYWAAIFRIPKMNDEFSDSKFASK